MPDLRDPFQVTHQKKVQTKQGEISLTYVSWSQVADRLDEAAPGWSFTIRQLGEDWCWGQLAFDGRTFDSIGYAENADADWKKEVLKDAVSDALKRCAAMAGVGRYLYDKDTPQPRPVAPQRPATPSQPVGPTPAPVRSSTEVPEPPLDWDVLSDKKPEPFALAQVAKIDPDGSWTFPQLADRAKSLSVPVKVLGDTSKRLFGQNAWKLTELTGEQRYAIAVEVGLL